MNHKNIFLLFLLSVPLAIETTHSGKPTRCLTILKDLPNGAQITPAEGEKLLNDENTHMQHISQRSMRILTGSVVMGALLSPNLNRTTTAHFTLCALGISLCNDSYQHFIRKPKIHPLSLPLITTREGEPPIIKKRVKLFPPGKHYEQVQLITEACSAFGTSALACKMLFS